MVVKKKSKTTDGRMQTALVIILSALVILLLLFGLGYLKLGAWYLPTSQITVDTEGIHFYSGHTGSIMWTLESEWRQPVSTVQTSGVGNYNFPLPASSGKFHIYCTASGCDAGEWLLINLSTVPLSPADTIISGYCLGSYERAYSCFGISRDFIWQSSTGVPFTFRCNTCTSRNVYDVSGVSTQAVIISPPPMPTATATTTTISTPTPSQTPTYTYTSVPTPTPVAQTAVPTATPTSPAPVSTPSSGSVTPKQDDIQGGGKTGIEQPTLFISTNIILVVLMLLIIASAVYIDKYGKYGKKEGKKKRWK